MVVQAQEVTMEILALVAGVVLVVIVVRVQMEDHTVAGAEGELIILVVQVVLVRALTALFVLSGREIHVAGLQLT
jgi:hypothetical protein